jgi:hypothetical protein
MRRAALITFALVTLSSFAGLAAAQDRETVITQYTTNVAAEAYSSDAGACAEGAAVKTVEGDAYVGGRALYLPGPGCWASYDVRLLESAATLKIRFQSPERDDACLAIQIDRRTDGGASGLAKTSARCGGKKLADEVLPISLEKGSQKIVLTHLLLAGPLQTPLIVDHMEFTSEAKTHEVEVRCDRGDTDVRDRINRYVEKQRADFQTFTEKQRQAFEEFSKTQRTEEETRQYKERQEVAWQAFLDQQARELEAFSQEAWGSYYRACKENASSGGTGTSDPQQPRPAGSGYSYSWQEYHHGSQPLPDPCRERLPDLERLLSALSVKWQARHQAFQAQFDAAREEFMKSSHTEQEWRDFADRWHGEARRLHRAMQDDMQRAAQENGLLDCYRLMKWDEHGPVPIYGTQPAQAAPVHGERIELDEGARRIMERCEARMREIMEKYRQHYGRADYQYRDHQMTMATAPPAETAPQEPQPAPPTMDGRLHAELEALKAECEREMREYMAHKGASYGTFRMRVDENGNIIVEGKYVRLRGVPEAQMMKEIHVRDVLYVDRLFVNGFLAEFRPAQTKDGTAIDVFDAKGQKIIGLHDNPKGVINLATSRDIPSITLDLADALELRRTDNGIAFRNGDRHGAVLVHDGYIESGEGNVLKIVGRATFVVTSGEASAAVRDAVLKKHVGAEVVIASDGTANTAPIGDLQVVVQPAQAKKFVARVESESGHGKTVVFKADPALFGTDRLKVRVVGIEPDGSVSPLAVQAASSLEDVLDPTDDGDVVEYWIVKDAHGLQVLVSFPHFSEKEVTVQADDASPLAALPGFGFLALAGAGALVLSLGLKRRRA